MKALGVVLGLVCVGVPHVPGAELDWLWNSPTGGPFAVSSNWLDQATQSIHGVPGEFDTALHVGHLAPYLVTSNVTEEIGRLAVMSSSGIADNVTYDFDGQQLLANGGTNGEDFGFELANESGAARLMLLDGQYRGSALRVSIPTTSTASARLTIGAGATLTTGATTSPLLDWIGGRGAASELVVQDGGSVDSVGLRVGANPAERGAVRVTGAGSLLQAVMPGAMQVADARALSVGREGDGQVDVTNGGLVRTQQLAIGGDGSVGVSSGVGQINVDNATLEFAAVFDPEFGHRTSMSLGISGSGQLNLTNQAQFSASGSIELGGLSAGGTGAGSFGAIDARGGADLQTRDLKIGRDLGCSGSVVLSGAGTTLIDIYGMQVGYRGHGSLLITEGATARFAVDPDVDGTGFLNVGRFGANSTGSVTVDGAGSLLSVEGDVFGLVVGREGQAELTISGGGMAVVPQSDVVIGRIVGAAGHLTVSGSGSILRGGKNISVGGLVNSTVNSGSYASGQGALTITDGGSIEAVHLWVYADDSVTLSEGGFGTLGTPGAVVNVPNTLSVLSGGRVSGEGLIQGHIDVHSGGVLDPRGVSQTGGALNPATLTIEGDLRTNTGASVRMRIDRAGLEGVDYDSLRVTGAATLGGELEIVLAADYVPSADDEFNLIVGSSAIAGSFTIDNRLLAPAAGGQAAVVWGDYREDHPAPGADRYYLAPRRQADFNGVGGVTGADFTIWADHFGQQSATFGEGDANGDRQVTGADFTLWADSFGNPSLTAAPPAITSIPEPGGLLLAAAGLTALTLSAPAVGWRRAKKIGRTSGAAVTIVRTSEGDGTRTRNHRIDSPVL